MLTSQILLSVAASATEMNIEGLIRDLAFILILGAITTLFFKWIKQPVVLGYIVAGFLASPNFEYLPSVTTLDNIEFWAQIGIIVLLFSLGLEFSFKKLLNAGGSAVITALIIVIGMMFSGFFVGQLLKLDPLNSLFLGGMLSMSSTTIIIKAFNDLNLTHKKFASQVFAVLIVEDLFAVVMMVILSSIAINNSVQSADMIFSISKLAFFLIIWFAIGVYVLPSMLNRSRRFLNSETLLIVSMGLCLGMAVFSVYCGFSLALGAFVMGSILAGTSFAERIEHVTVSIKDLFGSVFFISVGMMVKPDIIVQYATPIIILSAVVIIGMIIFGTFGMLVSGQTLKVAIESGFSLTQIGEFAFIIATLGMELNVLEPQIYPIVVAVSVLTTFTTPYFIRMAEPAYRFVERHLPSRLHFLITRYSAKTSEASEIGIVWRKLLKRYIWRFLLYVCVLTAISLVAQIWLLPALLKLSPEWGQLSCLLLTLAAMSPFLIALSNTTTKKSERQILINHNAHFDMPLIVMRVFRLLTALGFVCYIISAFYTITIGLTAGIIVFILITVVLSKRLSTRLNRIEEKFVNNLNERDLRRSGANNNIISNLHLSFMTVGYGCPYVGMRLADSNLRSRYGVSIASIQRGGTNIPIPGGEIRIFPGDILSVIGTEEEIQTLLPLIEASTDTPADQTKASDLKLTSLLLSEQSPLIGKTVEQSELSTTYQSLLVSLSRDEQFITPDRTTTFAPGDTLWLVADPARIAPLR